MMKPKTWNDIKTQVLELIKKSATKHELSTACSRLMERPVTPESIRHAYRTWRSEDRHLPLFSDALGSDLEQEGVSEGEEIREEEEQQQLHPAELRVVRLERELSDARRSTKLALRSLEQAEERVSVALAIAHPNKPPIIEAREKLSKTREATAVALASDWHIEERVDAKTINGVNSYDPAEAERRAANFFIGTDWLIKQQRGKDKYLIKDLILWLGGDIISGHIHPELIETNYMTPIQGILFAQKLFISGIDYLLKHSGLERIIVPCNVGNHERTTKDKPIQRMVEHSYAWLLYHSLKQYYSTNKKIEFVIADGQHLYLEVYDKTVRFTHGDWIKYGGGVGGLTVPIRKAIDSWNVLRKADYTCIGHFHQYMDCQDIIVNGSLIGYNGYALSIKARYEPPQQAFFLIDSKRGKCLSTPIWVGDSWDALT